MAFEQQCSPLSVECHDMTYGQSRKSIMAGAIDVGLIYKSTADKQIFEFVPVSPADFCILMPKDHPIARLDEVSFRDIAGNTLLFIYGLEHLSSEIQQQIMENEVNINCIPRNRSVLVSSIRSGKGLHMLPRLFASSYKSDDIVSRPFKPFSQKKQFCLAYLKESPYQVREFAQHVAGLLKELYS